MTDRPSLRNSLTIRLVAAFVLVAIVAVLALAGLTLWRAKHTVGQLAGERQQATADSIAATLALEYGQHGSWEGVDVHPAAMIAMQADVAVAVHDKNGDEVTLRNSMMGTMPVPAGTTHGDGPAVTADIIVGGQRVGVAEITFANSELAMAERHVRDALRGAVLLGTLLASGVAVLAAVPLSRRIVRPLRRVTDAARKVGEGDPTARVGHHDDPGELGQLAGAFDEMADRLADTEVARRNLVADVAHELRTPLTLLRGNCEEVLDGMAEPSLDRFVQLHDDVLRLGRLVDDLNALAGADAATSEGRIAFEPVDLGDIVRSAAGDLSGLVEAHRHDLTLALAEAHTVGDPARLTQIVTNLLTNAIKFTPPGGRISVATTTDPSDASSHITARRSANSQAQNPISGDPNASVRLRVSDTGPGISTDDQRRVFERFYRAPGAAGIAGNGIGLAVVDQLVRAHRGTISISSNDAGTVVEVVLPHAPPASPAGGGATPSG